MKQPSLEEVYETLVRDAYDQEKRPPQMTLPEALIFAWETMLAHGLPEDIMRRVHAKIRNELRMTAFLKIRDCPDVKNK